MNAVADEALEPLAAVPAPSFDLTGRVAIVTGGSQGVGWGIAAGLARAGAAIVVANRNVAQGNAAVAVLEEIGAQAIHVEADVSASGTGERIVGGALNRFERLDILVNCSGIVVRGASLDYDEADWDRTFDTNLKGAWLCARAAARAMIPAGGVIVNVASLNATRPGQNKFAYGASKAGLVQLTRALATEWAPHGIRVNAIAPGMIASARLMDRLTADRDALREALARIPLGRPGTAADVAGIAVFLASDASSYITGQVVTLDGGSGLT